MAEPRRRNQVLFQVKGRKPMPSPYPWVDFASRDELRAAVARAARFYWAGFRRADVTIDGSNWRECRGEVFLRLPGGLTVDARFVPVFDPNRPAAAQSCRQAGGR